MALFPYRSQLKFRVLHIMPPGRPVPCITYSSTIPPFVYHQVLIICR